MADYIYNPAESIKQSFQQTQAGIGNIFSQVIAQQQRDYNLAESAFQNIEALKKDVNIFGQKNITTKSNDLLKQAGSAILKDGKLDYSKLGEIRQSISDIKDLKAGYDVGAKEYERMLQLGVANKDNLVSFERFYKELSSRMSDENLVKNPQDLQKAMAETYTNNLDSTKMYGKSFLGANPYQKIAQDITDPKTGALMRVQAELPTGWTIDARGNKIPPAPKSMVVNGQTVTMDYADQELARLQSTNPDVLMLMKKQAGFGGQNMSDKDLVKAYIDRIPMTVQSTQVKSSDDLRKEAAQAKAAEFNVATQQEKFDMDMAVSRAQIGAYGRRGQEGSSGGFNPQSLADLAITVNENGKIANFGGGITIDVPAPSRRAGGAADMPFKAVRTRVLANGKKQVGGYYLDADNKVKSPQLVYVDFDEGTNRIQSGLTAGIERVGGKDKDFLKAQMDVFNRVEIPQKMKFTKQQISDINTVKKNNGDAVKDMSDIQIWNLMQNQE
jgi:hypothetical protein